MLKEFDQRQMNFEIYTNLIEEKQKFENAALVIQRFFRRKKQHMTEKLAFRTNFVIFQIIDHLKILLKERRNSEKIAKEFQKLNATTGKILLKKSFNHIESIFSNLNEIFLQKSSVKYENYKVKLSELIKF